MKHKGFKFWSSHLKWSLPALAIAIGLNAAIKVQVDSRLKQRKSEIDIRYLPSPKAAKVGAFGYHELGADILWIEALNYFGENLVKVKKQGGSDYKYLSQYVSLIASLDPYFAFFYEWAATIFIYNWMPITDENLAKSIYFGNVGISNLSKVFRFVPSMIKKNAYNFSIETKDFRIAADYLVFLSRVSPADRDSLLIAATYYDTAGRPDLGRKAREEFFAYSFLEYSDKEKRVEAFGLLTSGGINSGAIEFLRNARIQAEQDEDLKEAMKIRFSKSDTFFEKTQASQPSVVDLRIQKIMSIPSKKTHILPPMMNVLFSL